jgi:hypothetical protein
MAVSAQRDLCSRKMFALGKVCAEGYSWLAELDFVRLKQLGIPIMTCRI